MSDAWRTEDLQAAKSRKPIEVLVVQSNPADTLLTGRGVQSCEYPVDSVVSKTETMRSAMFIGPVSIVMFELQT